MAPLAIAVAYVGGWLFAAFWLLAAATILWEWFALVGVRIAAFHMSPGRAGWLIAGFGYAATLWLATITLRSDSDHGFAVILFLFAVVWTTDILGYFVGRAIGGAKLAPAISPGKTWSGALGGTVGAMAVAYLGARYWGGGGSGVALIILAGVLSVVAQLGDLLESAIKRHFGAKDASHLIPGHGGVMDRLDGFWAAACLAAIVGVVRGGVDAPARGLLLW